MTRLFQLIRLPENPPAWGLLLALAALVAHFVFTALVGPSLTVLVLFPQAEQLSAALLSGWLVGGLLTVFFVQRIVRTPEAMLDLRLNESPTPLLILFGIGFGAAVTLDLIAILVAGRVLPPIELAALLNPSPLLWILAALFMVLVQPLAEELVFRGMLFPALRAAQGVWVAILLSSAFYGLFHFLLFSSETFNLWYGLLEPMLAGLVIGVTRAATRSTRAAVAVHVGVGVFGLVKTLLIVALV